MTLIFQNQYEPEFFTLYPYVTFTNLGHCLIPSLLITRNRLAQIEREVIEGPLWTIWNTQDRTWSSLGNRGMKECQDWADPILSRVTSRFLSDASFGQFLCSTSSYCRPVSSNRFWIFCSVIISSCLGIMPMLTKLSDLELEGPIPPWSNFLRPLETSFFHNPNERVSILGSRVYPWLSQSWPVVMRGVEPLPSVAVDRMEAVRH